MEKSTDLMKFTTPELEKMTLEEAVKPDEVTQIVDYLTRRESLYRKELSV